MKDKWAIVLDFLPEGHPGLGKPEPIAQAVGEKYFSLLEVVSRKDIELEVGDRIYIGEGTREKVKYIKKSISLEELTTLARSELEGVIKDLINEADERFVNFFNNATPISTRMHSLELLPGIGKKHMWEIIEARKEKPFESYEDLKERVPSIPDPKKLLFKRIMTELKGEDPRHRIFVLHKKKER